MTERVRAFLPEIKAANERLHESANLEEVSSDEEHVEMVRPISHDDG